MLHLTTYLPHLFQAHNSKLNQARIAPLAGLRRLAQNSQDCLVEQRRIPRVNQFGSSLLTFGYPFVPDLDYLNKWFSSIFH